jgi:hypothetical protein
VGVGVAGWSPCFSPHTVEWAERKKENINLQEVVEDDGALLQQIRATCCSCAADVTTMYWEVVVDN